jgi:hypothetical protein
MADLRRTILELLAERSPEASICPSEAARVAGGAGWRTFMDPVRLAASELAAEGMIRVTQGDREVDIGAARGPVRLRAAHGRRSRGAPAG